MLKSFWKSTKKNDNTKNNRETSNSLKKRDTSQTVSPTLQRKEKGKEGYIKKYSWGLNGQGYSNNCKRNPKLEERSKPTVNIERHRTENLM